MPQEFNTSTSKSSFIRIWLKLYYNLPCPQTNRPQHNPSAWASRFSTAHQQN